ncbi:MAG: putative Rossmann-fold nucleotide-binding protein [Phenylobacterium sp.]|jgi:predicted Rossmann-fold nucleotide-binding protein
MTSRTSISIFGSANLSGSVDYHQQINQLGRTLASLEVDIQLGSTTGLLDCFLQGAHSWRNAQTWRTSHSWKEAQDPNNKLKQSSTINLVMYGDSRYTTTEYIDQLITKPCYFTRLSLLCDADIFIVLDGQLGTMAETIVSWNQLQANQDFDKKIIIFGQQESRKLHFLLESFTFSKPAYQQLVYFADTVEDIIKMIPTNPH